MPTSGPTGCRNRRLRARPVTRAALERGRRVVLPTTAPIRLLIGLDTKSCAHVAFADLHILDRRARHARRAGGGGRLLPEPVARDPLRIRRVCLHVDGGQMSADPRTRLPGSGGAPTIGSAYPDEES